MSHVERIKCGNGNCYIVSDGNNSILADTCSKQYRRVILEKCKTRNIKLTVLTHGHVDHIQNAAFLSNVLNAPIAMHKADYELTKDNRIEPLFAHSLLGKMIIKMSQKTFGEKVESFQPEFFLKDGDSLSEYGVSAEIIELPGHTKGSIGIKTDGSIIVGDALMNIIYVSKSPLYGNRSAMEESAAKISSLGNATIYFGHGKPTKNRKW